MGDTGEALHRGLAVVKDIAERTGKHLFEPDREHAIGAAERDQLPREKERGRSGRAIIVDVDDRNAGAADPVDRRPAPRRTSTDITDIGLLDMAVVHRGVGEPQRPAEDTSALPSP